MPQEKERLTRDIEQDCARGMVYLHSWSPAIIHRDLKSSNVLITASWKGKVADCGESRRKAMNTTMTQIGTPFWCAPEILNGGVYDEKADVFSFAIMLFEVVARDIPYRAQYKAQKGHNKAKKQKIMKKVRKGELRPGPLTDAVWTPRLKEIMSSCWAQDARARPGFVEVVKMLTQLLAGEDLRLDGEAPTLPAASMTTGSTVGSIGSSMGDTTKVLVQGRHSIGDTATTSSGMGRGSFTSTGGSLQAPGKRKSSSLSSAQGALEPIPSMLTQDLVGTGDSAMISGMQTGTGLSSAQTTGELGTNTEQTMASGMTGIKTAELRTGASVATARSHGQGGQAAAAMAAEGKVA